MSNGGYKGNTPARETSPEQYPGVWELTEQFQAQADENWPFQDTDCAPRSLRFDGNNAKLSRTPSIAGSSSVFTLSCWVKRTLATNYDELLSIDGEFGIRFTNTDKLHVDLYAPDGSSWAVICDSKAVFRDPSAWYSIILVLDSNAGTTNADRLKLWVNGQPSEFDFTTYWGGLIAGNVAKLHTVVEHTIGMRGSSLSGDFLIADYHFLDGQAVYPEEFGFFDGQGVWQPKRFTGDYGLKTTTFTGVTTGGAQYSGPYSNIFDGNPASRVLTYTSTSTKLTLDSPPAWNNKIEIRALRYGGVFEINGIDISGLAWTAAAQYLDATSLLGSSGTLQTIEVGDVGSNYVALYSIKLDGVELIQPTSGGNNSFHLDFSDGVKDLSGLGNDWTPQNLHIPSPDTASYYTTSTLYHTLAEVLANGTNRGQSGFTLSSTEFVYIVPGKGGIDGQLAHGAGTTWPTPYVYANKSNNSYPWIYTGGYGSSEAALQYWYDDATDASGGELSYAYGSDIPIYLLSDARNYVSGVGYQPTTSSSFGNTTVFPPLINTANNNPFTGDLFLDSPVNGNQTDAAGLGGIVQGNYATFNPLDKTSGITLSDGNLKATGQANGSDRVRGTIAIPRSGKWYFEFTLGSAFYGYIGISNIDGTKLVGRNEDGRKYTEAGHVSTPFASITAGDVVGVALDNNTTLTFYKNGVAESTTVTVDSNTDYFAMANFYNAIYILNSGQSAFKHPLAGYKSLCTSNLPEPSIPVPSQYFDTKLFAGTGSSQAITGYNFSPDLAWIKNSSSAQSHALFDAVRGATKGLHVDLTQQEWTDTNTLTAFNSDGFTLNGHNVTNASSNSYVGWAWDAGDATTTIAAGGLNSSTYDQSQTWSSSLSTNASFGLAASRAFDGNLSTLAATTNSTTSNLLFTKTFTGVTSLRVYMDHGTNWRVRVNGGTWANDSTFTSTNASWRDITSLVPANGTVTSIESYVPSGVNNGTNWSAVEVNGKLLVDSPAPAKTLTRLRFKTDWNWMYVSQITINGSALTTGTLDNSGSVWSGGDNWKNGSTGSGNETFSQSARGDWFDVTLASSIANFNNLEIFVYLDSSSGTTTNIFEIELFYSDGTSFTKAYAANSDAPNQSSAAFNSRLAQNFGNLGPAVASVPSIPSTVRANPSAGFSICKITTPSSDTVYTFGHGLNKVPKFIIYRIYDQSSVWWVHSADLGVNKYLYLHGTNAVATNNNVFNNTAPTNSVITDYASNANHLNEGRDMIYYCFAPVEGYSSFGSFQNPSSSEGAFVHLGFKPALLMVKCALNISSSSGAGDWIIKDSTRSPFNNPSDGNTLVANVANAEDGYYGAGQAAIDILSNGFKIRHPNSSPAGDTGRLYIYAAWAESPFKTARAQ